MSTLRYRTFAAALVVSRVSFSRVTDRGWIVGSEGVYSVQVEKDGSPPRSTTTEIGFAPSTVRTPSSMVHKGSEC
jgi:hypothetical protein